MNTTIKVSGELRDRLKQQARRSGRTLGAHLAALADEADRAQRFAELKAAVAATTPAQMASYSAETRAWETTELTDAVRG